MSIQAHNFFLVWCDAVKVALDLGLILSDLFNPFSPPLTHRVLV